MAAPSAPPPATPAAMPPSALAPPEPEPTAPKVTGSGTGFFIGERRFLTNAHVVDGCSRVTVGTLGEATIVARDDLNDLALLQVDADPEVEPLVFSAEPTKLGADVAALGYPFRQYLAPSINITTGIVSALAGIRGDSRFLQITAPVTFIDLGHVFSSGAELVAWLEGLASGTFPRVTLDEEGAFTELHAFPVRQDLIDRLESPSSPGSHVRLLAVQIGAHLPKVTLDVVIPRRTLVRSVYREWLAARDDDPVRFDSEWLRFGGEVDNPVSPFARSPLIEEWLAEPETFDGD